MPSIRVSCATAVSGSRVLLLALLFSTAACAVPATSPSVHDRASTHAAAAKTAAHTFVAQPLAFEPNLGQFDARARYAAHAHGDSVFITDDGVIVSRTRQAGGASAAANARGTASASIPIERVALHLQFPGARRHAAIEAEQQLPGHSNYLIGNDPRHWHRDVPQYARIVLRDAYPGIDIAWYDRGGGIEYDLIVAPGGDPARVRLTVDGARHLELDAAGDVVVHTALGDFVQRLPVVYQMINGVRYDRRATYALRHTRAGDEVAFAVADYDRRFALVLDPVLDFGTYFGGLQSDAIYGLAIDPVGDIYIAGSTLSDAATFPDTVGAYQTTKKNFFDAFIAKIKDDGSQLLYATYIGGDGNDFGNTLAVDANGQAVLGGETSSDNYPLQNAVQAGRNGAGTSGIVTKLNAAGNGLVFSTYLGGNSVSEVFAIASDAAAATYVTGRSAYNSGFPTTAGAFQTGVSSASGVDAFVVKYDSSGTRVYSTLLGAGLERGDGIAVDAAGAAYVAGTINAASINGVTAHLIGPGGGGDAMIAKLNADGSALDYLTRVGGSSIEQAVAITLDAANNAYFTGHSFSSDLPSTPAAPGGTNVALFGALDASGTTLTGPGLTWYGSAAPFNPSCSQGGAFGTSIALDPLDAVAYIAGYGCPISTMSSVGPVADLGCAPTCNTDTNKLNAFLLRYTYPAQPATPVAVENNAPQSTFTAPLLASSTLIAGMSGSETLLWQVRTDAVGRVTAAGDSTGTVATPHAIDATANGGDDGVVFRPSYKAVPPFVRKEFSRATVNDGESVYLTFTIANKNPPASGISLTGIVVDDVLEDCLSASRDGSSGFSHTVCNGALIVSERRDSLRIVTPPGGALTPGQECTFKVTVWAKVPVITCPNSTSPIHSDQGDGNSGSAEVGIEPVPFRIWSRPTGQGPGNTAEAGNWDGGIAAPTLGSAEVFPPNTATAITNDLDAQLALNRLSFSGSNFVIGGNAFNLTAAIENAGNGNSLAAPVKFLQLARLQNTAGTLAFSGGVDIAGDLHLFGAGATTIGGVLSGTGDLVIAGIGSVTITAAPTFTGSVQVTGGTLFGNAAIGVPVNVEGAGTARGTGPFSGAVYAGDLGRLFPGVDATPVNLALGTLSVDEDGVVELGFSANNAQHSTLAVSGSVAIGSAMLKLDFGSVPAVATTFSNLLTAPGTISGCFTQTAASPPSVVFTVQCTANAVSVVIKATDRLFAASFDH